MPGNKGTHSPLAVSAASSLALYALNVINFNPMDYGCLFERFLNLERFDPPDIDIDFADGVRQLVIDYLVEKYGAESVGSIAAFHSLGARFAIRDVGRALDIPLESVDRLTKLIPNTLGITIAEALEDAPQFKEAAEEPENQELIELSKAIEGMKRHISTHASGIVVSNGPLTDYVPLFKDKHDRIATQFEGKTISNIGMVKFDFLGVRTLSETYYCLGLIKQRHGVDLKLEDIPFDDKETYDLLSKGLVAGLFQLETSAGMRRVIMQIKPDNFEEFTAIPALYRPGPLDSGMMDSFIRRKLKLEEVTYPHPLLEDALKNTYGVCVYQEQVMQIARDMAGFTVAEADLVRFAMSKKIAEMLQELRVKFIEGAIKNGVKEEEAAEVFELLEPFSGYAFNKSHTVTYSILSYQMAYLKTHYPREFMASMMTGESGSSEKIMNYIAECRKLSEFLGTEIQVLPPDINSSESDFTVVGDDIRFGLAAVKNVSELAIEAIVEAREKDGSFQSLQDFCERVDTKAIKKNAIESLIMAGAFDLFDGHRAQYIASLENVLKAAQSAQQDRERGQMTIFGAIEEDVPATQAELADTPEWDTDELLRNEKEQLGFYLSGHPLQHYEDIIKYYTTATSQTLVEHPNGTEVSVAGLASSVRLTKTRQKGDQMAIMRIDDLEGAINVVVFPKAYANSSEAIEEGSIVWIRGTVSADRKQNGAGDEETEEEEVRQVMADQVLKIDQVVDQLTSAVEVTISEEDVPNQAKMEALQKISQEQRGDCDLILRLMSSKFGGEVIAQCSQRFNINYTPEIISRIENLFGSDCAKPSNRTTRAAEKTTYSTVDAV